MARVIRNDEGIQYNVNILYSQLNPAVACAAELFSAVRCS